MEADPTPSGSVTEHLVLHLKEGIDLQDVRPDSTSQASKTFIGLLEIIKAQPEFIRQFWGHEVENPQFFVWVIEWQQMSHSTSFPSMPEYPAFLNSCKQLFHWDSPKTPIALYTTVPSPPSALAAFRSGITEIAFYTMTGPRPSPSRKQEILDGSEKVINDVQKIGGATGAAIGWVFSTVPKPLAEGPNTISLYGVFGYPSLATHMVWRETPEGRAARGEDDSVSSQEQKMKKAETGEQGDKNGEGKQKEGNEEEEKKEGSMIPATIVPGIDGETGYFHVVFREGW